MLRMAVCCYVFWYVGVVIKLRHCGCRFTMLVGGARCFVAVYVAYLVKCWFVVLPVVLCGFMSSYAVVCGFMRLSGSYLVVCCNIRVYMVLPHHLGLCGCCSYMWACMSLCRCLWFL